LPVFNSYDQLVPGYLRDKMAPLTNEIALNIHRYFFLIIIIFNIKIYIANLVASGYSKGTLFPK